MDTRYVQSSDSHEIGDRGSTVKDTVNIHENFEEMSSTSLNESEDLSESQSVLSESDIEEEDFEFDEEEKYEEKDEDDQ